MVKLFIAAIILRANINTKKIGNYIRLFIYSQWKVKFTLKRYQN